MGDLRRAEIISAAARVISAKGYQRATMGEVGAAVGITGPGIYRYFSGKEAMLAAILVDISERLVHGAEQVIASMPDSAPDEVVHELVKYHVNFAIAEPDRIWVQEREVTSLLPDDAEQVRELQRRYLHLWTEMLRLKNPALSDSDARLKVQLAAGLINCARYPLRWAEVEVVRAETLKMALAVLEVVPQSLEGVVATESGTESGTAFGAATGSADARDGVVDASEKDPLATS